MFPMVATTAEFDAGRAILERELTHLRKHGHALPERVFVGAMLEVPSLLFQLDEILTRVDFLSVGSNDLMQFLFAADRSNVRVSDRFDPLLPTALRAFRMVAEAGERHNKPITLCGELASRPLEAIALAALGYRLLSVSPASLGPIKSTLLELDVAAARRVLMPLLDDNSGKVNIRAALRSFAQAEGLPL